jgi:hypothetical protein
MQQVVIVGFDNLISSRSLNREVFPVKRHQPLDFSWDVGLALHCD